MTDNKLKYSVIVLLEEQHEDFAEFIQDLYNLFSSRKESFEILIMANGTGGFLRDQLAELQNCNDKLKAFELNIKTPQAICLKTGLKASSGKIIITCGSYKQITERSFLRLLDSLDDELDIISPWRQNRIDPRFKRFQSKLFNTLVRRITRYDLHDLSCTVRIFRREVLEETEVYGNMYRFLPIIAARKGFKTKEVKSEHCREPGRIYFFALSDYVSRLIDIFTLYFNLRFTRKPLRFFSTIGLAFLLIGLFMGSYVLLERIFMGYPIGNRPTLILAILSSVLGVQVASVGLLGEIIAFVHGRHRKEYTIEKLL
jgi:hypothetical protein